MSINTSSTGRAAPRSMPDRAREQMMPNAVAARVIETLLAKHGLMQSELCRIASSPEYPVIGRRVYRVLNNAAGTTSIHLLDAILTSLGEQAMWHDEPLAAYLEVAA